MSRFYGLVLLVLSVVVSPAIAAEVCWYSEARKTPKQAIISCDKVIAEKDWSNDGYKAAMFLSRALARIYINDWKNIAIIKDDLDQSIAAMPQSTAYVWRTMVFFQMSKKSNRKKNMGLAALDAEKALGFGDLAPDIIKSMEGIIKDSRKLK